MRELIARAIARKTYAFATVEREGDSRYDCGEWEDMGCDAQGVYLDAADDVINLLIDQIKC